MSYLTFGADGRLATDVDSEFAMLSGVGSIFSKIKKKLKKLKKKLPKPPHLKNPFSKKKKKKSGGGGGGSSDSSSDWTPPAAAGGVSYAAYTAGWHAAGQNPPITEDDYNAMIGAGMTPPAVPVAGGLQTLSPSPAPYPGQPQQGYPPGTIPMEYPQQQPPPPPPYGGSQYGYGYGGEPPRGEYLPPRNYEETSYAPPSQMMPETEPAYDDNPDESNVFDRTESEYAQSDSTPESSIDNQEGFPMDGYMTADGSSWESDSGMGAATEQFAADQLMRQAMILEGQGLYGQAAALRGQAAQIAPDLFSGGGDNSGLAWLLGIGAALWFFSKRR